jgi:hypothetical protein
MHSFGREWSGTESAVTEAITGLLYQHQMMMSVELSVECMAPEIEVLAENLPECRVIHHKPHIT